MTVGHQQIHTTAIPESLQNIATTIQYILHTDKGPQTTHGKIIGSKNDKTKSHSRSKLHKLCMLKCFILILINSRTIKYYWDNPDPLASLGALCHHGNACTTWNRELGSAASQANRGKHCAALRMCGVETVWKK